MHVNETCAEMLAKCSLCRSPIYEEINVYKWGSNTKNSTSLDTSEPNAAGQPPLISTQSVRPDATHAACMHMRLRFAVQLNVFVLENIIARWHDLKHGTQGK